MHDPSFSPIDSPIALIVAAGSGTRAGPGKPKQYRTLEGTSSLLRRSVEAFYHHPKRFHVFVVISPDHRFFYDEAVSGLALPDPLFGGETRQESVFSGLCALHSLGLLENRLLLIHDAARPFVSSQTIDRVLEGLKTHRAVVPVLPVKDTLIITENEHLSSRLERASLRAAQTPQGFLGPPLLAAHHQARASALAFSDDASLTHWAGEEVLCVPGEEGNSKVTTPEDLQRLSPLSLRVGQGFDVHAFTQGDSVTLCGVEIPHSQALLGHSDADVALHALTDALLGTLGEGDIGVHFPPSDPQWKGAASSLFVTHAFHLLKKRGGTLLNVDLTIVAQAPKISPYVPAMKAVLSSLLSLPPSRIAIKATTSESLGFTGRKEGMVALALATCSLPDSEEEFSP